MRRAVIAMRIFLWQLLRKFDAVDYSLIWESPMMSEGAYMLYAPSLW